MFGNNQSNFHYTGLPQVKISQNVLGRLLFGSHCTCACGALCWCL